MEASWEVSWRHHGRVWGEKRREQGVPPPLFLVSGSLAWAASLPRFQLLLASSFLCGLRACQGLSLPAAAFSLIVQSSRF